MPNSIFRFSAKYASVAATTLAAILATSRPNYAQFDTVINVPPSVVEDGAVLNYGTQLNVFENGEVGNGVRAGELLGSGNDIEVNMFGGEIGIAFNAFNGTTLNLFDGYLMPFSEFRDGTFVNIYGGRIGWLRFREGSVANVHGGQFESLLSASVGSSVIVSGGRVARLNIGSDSNVKQPIAEVTLSGGSYGDWIQVFDYGKLTLVGGEFKLNGNPLQDVSNLKLKSNDLFTMTLADGTPFFASPLDNDDLGTAVVESVEVPKIQETEFVIDDEADLIPPGLRAGQCLTLRDGGQLPDDFTVVGGTLKVEGSTINSNLDVVDGQLMMSGGRIRFRASVFGDSEVLLSGGDLGNTSLFDGVSARINGGNTGSLQVLEGASAKVMGDATGWINAQTGSDVEACGGGASYFFDVGSTGTISGGRIVSLFQTAGSDVTIEGGEFELNGVPIGSQTDLALAGDDLLTGTLRLGDTFAFSAGFDSVADINLVQTDIPPIDQTFFLVDEAMDIVPPGLRAGQSLVLRDDGVLPPSFAAIGAEINVEGGVVGTGLELVDTTAVISAGEIGGGITGYRGANVVIVGGDFGFVVSCAADSHFDICGGNFNRFSVSLFSISENSSVHISGGRFVPGFEVFGSLNISGSEFALNGVPIAGLQTDVPREVKERNVVLTGKLVDGNDFSLELNSTPGEIGEDFVSNEARIFVTATDRSFPGDVNGDGEVNLQDIAPFVKALLAAQSGGPADINKDGVVDLSDIPHFINILLAA